MDQADIISGIRQASQTKYFTDNCEMVSLSRMNKLMVKLDVAKYE